MKKRILTILSAACVLFAAGTSYAESTTEAADDEVIKPSDYLVENALDYVQLGTYTGLEVEKQIYTVSDEDVESQIEENLYGFSYSEPVTDRPADLGDIVTVDITTTVDGTESKMDDFEIDLGYEILGSAFDENLNGARAGDHFEFEDTFTEEDYVPDWAGKTVSFDVTLKKISTYITPELTEDFVKENTDYETVDEYRQSVREDLEKQYAQQADTQAADDAIEAGMDASSFEGYPQELFDETYDDVVSSYEEMAEMFGMSLDELLEAYELTEDDVNEEAVEAAQRTIFISAVAIKENITVTADDALAFIGDSFGDYGYESPDEMRGEYGLASFAPYALEKKVGAWLLGRAVVTEVPYDEDDELELEYDDEDWDEEDDESWDEDDEEYWDEDEVDEEYWDEDEFYDGEDDWEEDEDTVYLDVEE